jgi:hypothetical protein
MRNQNAKLLRLSTIFVLLFILGCKKNEDTSPTIAGGPSVTTVSATNVGCTTATLGGNVTSEGACAVLVRGVVVGKAHNPSTSDLDFPDNTGGGTGSFTVAATGLLPSTAYYARAYAINCKGVNYGNEIQFTTPICGGGGVDTGYFNLTFDGGTFVADDMFGPRAGHVYPEGDTRFAFLTVDSASGEFSIAAQSSYMTDNSKSSGYSFALLYKTVAGTGIYTFTDAAADNTKSTTIQMRYGSGSLDPLSSNYSQFVNTGNESRHLSGSSCVSNRLNCATNTLHITTWGNRGSYVEGTVSGTVYETAKESANCTTSTPHNYTANFRLKRLQ